MVGFGNILRKLPAIYLDWVLFLLGLAICTFGFSDSNSNSPKSHLRSCSHDLMTNTLPEQFSASSSRSRDYFPYNAKMTSIIEMPGQSQEIWCASKPLKRQYEDEWIQIDFQDQLMLVNTIITKGIKLIDKEIFVSDFKLKYQRFDSNRWHTYKFANFSEIISGNKDSYTHSRFSLEAPIILSRLRIYPINTAPQVKTICLKFKLLGCEFVDNVVEYQMTRPNSDSYSNSVILSKHFPDTSYDSLDLGVSHKFDQNLNVSGREKLLTGGMGILFDNKIKFLSNYDHSLSVDDFEKFLLGNFVVWRNTRQKNSIQLIIKFSEINLISAIQFFVLNLPSWSLEPFSSIRMRAVLNESSCLSVTSQDFLFFDNFTFIDSWIYVNLSSELFDFYPFSHFSSRMIGKILCLEMNLSAVHLAIGEIIVNSTQLKLTMPQITELELYEKNSNKLFHSIETVQYRNTSSSNQPELLIPLSADDSFIRPSMQPYFLDEFGADKLFIVVLVPLLLVGCVLSVGFVGLIIARFMTRRRSCLYEDNLTFKIAKRQQALLENNPSSIESANFSQMNFIDFIPANNPFYQQTYHNHYESGINTYASTTNNNNNDFIHNANLKEKEKNNHYFVATSIDSIINNFALNSSNPTYLTCTNKTSWLNSPYTSNNLPSFGFYPIPPNAVHNMAAVQLSSSHSVYDQLKTASRIDSSNPNNSMGIQ